MKVEKITCDSCGADGAEQIKMTLEGIRHYHDFCQDCGDALKALIENPIGLRSVAKEEAIRNGDKKWQEMLAHSNKKIRPSARDKRMARKGYEV